MADVMQGLSLNPPELQETEPVQRESSFPTIEEFTGDSRYQEMNEFQKAAKLAKYQTGLIKYMNKNHGFSSQEEFDETIADVQSRVRKHVPNPNNLNTALKSLFGFNPGETLVADMSSLGATVNVAGHSAQIINEQKRRAIADAQTSAGAEVDPLTGQPRNVVWSRREAEKHVRETSETFKEWDGLRQGANLVLSENEERQGKDFIGGGEFNLTTIGSAANQLGADIAGVLWLLLLVVLPVLVLTLPLLLRLVPIKHKEIFTPIVLLRIEASELVLPVLLLVLLIRFPLVT